MRITHLHEALDLIQKLRQNLLDKQLFRGFSGPVRAFSGTVALIMAGIMASPYFPDTNPAHAMGWGVVFLAATLANGGAILYWFLYDPVVKRDAKRLRPTLDTLPPLAVGAVLTAALMIKGHPEYLFGIWMCMFGLSNLAARYVLPPLIALVGVFYVICGSVCLLAPNLSFLNPWPMGVVFFAGEWVSGLVLYFDRRRYIALSRYLEEKEKDDGSRPEP